MQKLTINVKFCTKILSLQKLPKKDTHKNLVLYLCNDCAAISFSAALASHGCVARTTYSNICIYLLHINSTQWHVQNISRLSFASFPSDGTMRTTLIVLIFVALLLGTVIGANQGECRITEYISIYLVLFTLTLFLTYLPLQIITDNNKAAVADSRNRIFL
jgi:uncharacterized membrane protein YwzB